ncbi:MAG: hypothetical protein ABI970_06730 [Chloroflexota bacterium]
MATIDFHNRPTTSNAVRPSSNTIYYARYPAIKSTTTIRTWRNTLWRIGLYARLVIIGAIMTLVGGVFPIIVSYELYFKSLLTITCSQCQIVDPKPYFEFDYVLGTVMGVFGFMVPILVLYVFIKILRSRSFRHDLFD